MRIEDQFLTATQLRERWGHMGRATLHRLIAADPDAPRPAMRIHHRRFFLLAFEARQRMAAAAQPKQLRRSKRKRRTA